VELRHDPTGFVLDTTDEVAKLAYLGALGLAGGPAAAGLRGSLLGMQRADGGFPSEIDPAVSGVRETVQTSLVLLDAGVEPEDATIEQALRFILGHQDACGGFGENPAVGVPSFVIELHGWMCITWLTASAIELMLRTCGREAVPCVRAVRWLREMQRADGSWPMHAGRPKGDPDSTAQIAFLLRELGGPDDPSFAAARKRLDADLTEAAETAARGYWVTDDGLQMPLDAYSLTYPVLASATDPPRRIRAGYDISDPRVKSLMVRLIDIQRDDGGWRPFWKDVSCPMQTVVALKVLAGTGAIPSEPLAVRADRWQRSVG